MTELTDYAQFAEGPLVFPFNGKKYELKPLGIEVGIEVAGIYSGKNKAWEKKGSHELFKLVLGPLWDEMVADGVPLDFAVRVGMTAVADHQYGREVALFTWETNADPKALEPFLEARAATTANRAQRRSNSTGGAKKTQPRASTKGTTSPDKR